MDDTLHQECTCDAGTVTWSEERKMYVCSGCGLPMPEWWYEWEDDPDTDCPHCGGSGMEDDSSKCPYCAGTGVIPEYW